MMFFDETHKRNSIKPGGLHTIKSCNASKKLRAKPQTKQLSGGNSVEPRE
jgi:hypothetical protein